MTSVQMNSWLGDGYINYVSIQYALIDPHLGGGTWSLCQWMQLFKSGNQHFKCFCFHRVTLCVEE